MRKVSSGAPVHPSTIAKEKKIEKRKTASMSEAKVDPKRKKVQHDDAPPAMKGSRQNTTRTSKKTPAAQATTGQRSQDASQARGKGKQSLLEIARETYLSVANVSRMVLIESRKKCGGPASSHR
jgi:hypothetical protein